MKLSEKQRLFSQAVAALIQHINRTESSACTLGDAYRDPRVFGAFGVSKGYGNHRSNHKRRLAIDLNLFVFGKYKATTAAHRPHGEWWEAYGRRKGWPLRWGGRFNDGNHYEWNG